MKERIQFIINPNSGVKKKIHIPKLIDNHLDKNKYDYEIVYTQRAGHATELAQKAVADGFDIITAVGGDGSLNEVAKGVMGTKATLGILPHGSGNGFSMHTNIGRDVKKAIEILNTGKRTLIDTCTQNGELFLNLAGFGFDGLVAYKLSQGNKRGFISYFNIAVKEAFTAKSSHYTIQLDDQPPMERDVFLFEVGNGTMFGYGFTIVPEGDLTDGLMNMLIVKKANKLRYLPLTARLLFANLHKGGKLVETFEAKKIKVSFDAPRYMHFDGEGFIQEENSVTFEIQPKSMQVILPKNGRY